MKKLPEPTIGEVAIVITILGVTGGIFMAFLIPAFFIAGGAWLYKAVFDVREDD